MVKWQQRFFRALVILLLIHLSASLSPGHTQLPPDVQFDLLKVQLVEAVKAEDHEKVLSTIKELEATGRPLPPSTDYFGALANFGLGKFIRAKSLLEKFFKEQGQEAKYYKNALSLYLKARPKAAAAARIKEAIKAQKEAAAAAGKSPDGFEDCSLCPVMVVIPAGSFTMGSPTNEKPGRYANEGPQHRVTIPLPLAVGKYEVTFLEWNACVSAGACDGDKLYHRGRRQGLLKPVIRLSWNNARQYIGWIQRKTGKPYRLLSEAEWEYAARAGTITAYAFGSSISERQVNFEGGPGDTLPVSAYRPNAFGLYNMHGNAREWVEDCWHENYSGAPTDGSAWTSGDCKLRVLRGGSYHLHPVFLRSASRSWDHPQNINASAGFRVARTLD